MDTYSASPTPPCTNWATAARVIQDAVDAAAAGDETAVTNGIYAPGGRPVGASSYEYDPRFLAWPFYFQITYTQSISQTSDFWFPRLLQCGVSAGPGD